MNFRFYCPLMLCPCSSTLMHPRRWRYALALLLLLQINPAFAQSTLYHLHQEASTTAGAAQLKLEGPDVAAVAIQSINLKGLTPRIIINRHFDTQAGVPGISGTIPAGSTVTFGLWMKKTAASGTMYPHAKLYVNSGTGTLLCAASGNDPAPAGGTLTAALTTTLTKYTFSCSTAATISLLASDRLYLSVGSNMTTGPGNKSVVVELHIEGTLNGNSDSSVTVPAITPPPPVITDVTPSTGAAGTPVRVTGQNFGASGSIRFNGVVAAPSTWNAGTIEVPVPAGASTGPVIVTGPGGQSGGFVFTVPGIGGLAGSVTRATGGAPIGGATIEVLRSGTVSASATTGADGAYSITNVWTGSYDVRFAAAGYLTEVKTGVSVSGPTTLNASLSAGGTITGDVRQIDGVTPIAGAGVSLLRDGAPAGSTTTSSSGGFALSAILPGTYSIEAVAPGYHPATVSGVVLSDAGTATANFTLEPKAASTVRYVYDELGRLTAVVDSSGDTAKYVYDAAGNITAIERGSSSAVAVIELVPDRGPIGTSVAIEGTGFSAIASENTVQFNGTSASITSATPTRIVTSVPAGATTGPVVVQTPTGTAASSAPFEVTANTAVPTVTGFTPTIGGPGTAVTITGTNFSTIVSNNNVRFNFRRASIASAVSTEIASEVPAAATSGRISVTTPLGTGTSVEDFYVPPAPYTAADVEYAGRIAFGTPLAVTFATTDKIGLLLFDGVKGREISLTWTPAGLRPVSVRAPDGANLFGTQFGGGFRERLVLPQTGTYTILLGPDSGSVPGTMTVTLFDVVDQIGSIVPGGQTVPVSITTPGQNARFTFDNTVQAVSLRVSDVTIPVSDVSIVKPDGTNLVAPTFTDDEGTFFDGRYLTMAGTYTVIVNPRSAGVGTANLTLRNASDALFSIVPDGPSVTATTTIEGQNARLTFSGVMGQRVSLKVTGLTFGSLFECSSTVSIVGVDGATPLAVNTCVSGNVFFEPVTLPSSGTFAVLFDPRSAHVGSATFTLWDVPADVTGTITPDGDEVFLQLLDPGLNAALSIAGFEGQRVSLVVTESTISSTGACMVIQILSGSQPLATNGCAGNPNAFIDTTVLTGTGPYVLTVNPGQDRTGTMKLKMHFVPVDFTTPIVPDGPEVFVDMGTPGQNARLPFTATAGQRVSVTVTESTISSTGACMNISVRRDSDGAVQSENGCASNPNAFVEVTPELTAGGHAIVINPGVNRTGTMKVQLHDVPPDVAGTLVVNGDAALFANSKPGQNGRYTFTGTAAQQVTVRISESGFVVPTCLRVRLYRGTGPLDSTTQLNSLLTCSASANMPSTTLPANSTYTIVIDPDNSRVSSLLVRVTNP